MTDTTTTTTLKEYEFHPIANIFPLMTDEEFEAFKEDIKTKTQQEPIILYQGKILDGRNRYKACKALYRDPITEEYKGSDPLGYVLSANLHRRHLKESQRATIAANLVTTNSETISTSRRRVGQLTYPPPPRCSTFPRR